MFLGRYEHTIDEKGRITFPSRFREMLSEGAFVTLGFDQNLIVMSSPRWNQLCDRIKKMSMTDPNARALQRFMFSQAAQIELDSAGRFILPPVLRKNAQLTSSAVYVGIGDDIEIWAPELLAEQDKAMENPTLTAKRFETLDLSLS